MNRFRESPKRECRGVQQYMLGKERNGRDSDSDSNRRFRTALLK